MDEQIAVERLVQQVKQYASERASDVARGAETRRVAALLMHKYGCGVADAVTTIYGSPKAAHPIFKIIDEETVKIDPLWRAPGRELWVG